MEIYLCSVIDVKISLCQLIFDNYTPAPGPSNISPSSPTKETPADASPVEDSLPQELDKLRHQLQYVKKQSLVLMEKARKSSEAEEIALQQAQAAIAEKDSAVAEATAAKSREDSMLQLLTDASLDMAGKFSLSILLLFLCCLPPYCSLNCFEKQ
jgi:hypothetical protein